MISELRSKEQTLGIIAEIESLTTEKSKAESKTKYGINTSSNPFLKLPLDLHR